ncbi:B12-binding domain-containing radical SAM protein [uncultured Desulfobacter sp.]|uniref:B12-binding domain-containing radical SAM protein n=1 Tax=uncultured Desulfobacter sp. TaxID=240139 RepID=UPI002AAA8066|nr:B12-binding domain-containing radical SAM protein [uncultured Desulfobacter sp.]
MKALLIQLPIPRLNLGLYTGNIPLAGACLKQATQDVPGWQVDLLSETALSWTGDQAIVRDVCDRNPDLVGFTVFAWNMERSVFLARQIKEKTGAGLIFGGPQVTEDTLDHFPEFIDYLVIGEGEALFRQVLENKIPGEKSGNTGAPMPRVLHHTHLSQSSMLVHGSPYVNGHLDLGPGQVMLLETQRGCPYKCGFCYYSKARKKRDIADTQTVIQGIDWALHNHAKELYLMDPSLNARPQLTSLLEKISVLNASKRLPIISEIRAESVTDDMAAQYANAGFTQFEVGLQSTTPKALDIMNRPTDLKRFIKGVKALQNQDITATIDLIFGLPGDTPQGFRNSVDFILEHDLYDHIQVFPLLVLPGTAFLRQARELGLEFAPHPPYPVIQTSAFSRTDMAQALDYAEDAFDRTFLPFPDLEISFAHPAPKDYYICPDNRRLLAKLVLDTPRPLEEIHELADGISSPFQIFFSNSALDQDYINRVTTAVSEKNPFVPLELIFITPGFVPDTDAVLNAIVRTSPHFLDLDQQYLYPEPGNRSILFTLVSARTTPFFQGPMQRQVMQWTGTGLPGLSLLADLFHLDGILIPGRGQALLNWQDAMAEISEDILPVCFADVSLQMRWLSLTEKGKYHLTVF